jgi:DMSO/TMAO reductase YedYZ heme-binding membrane subunit
MSSWNPLGVALGVVALYLLVAVQVTSLLRRRLPQKWWRRMHFASFGLFWLGTVHAVMAGTDAGNPVFAWTVIGTVGAVLFLTLLRIITPRGRRVPRPTAIPAEAA